MSDHLSRKELKQDKIHDALEHGAEAVYTHKQTSIIVLVVVLIIAAGIRRMERLPRAADGGGFGGV